METAMATAMETEATTATAMAMEMAGEMETAGEIETAEAAYSANVNSTVIKTPTALENFFVLMNTKTSSGRRVWIHAKQTVEMLVPGNTKSALTRPCLVRNGRGNGNGRGRNGKN